MCNARSFNSPVSQAQQGAHKKCAKAGAGFRAFKGALLQSGGGGCPQGRGQTATAFSVGLLGDYDAASREVCNTEEECAEGACKGQRSGGLDRKIANVGHGFLFSYSVRFLILAPPRPAILMDLKAALALTGAASPLPMRGR